jgi:hypothetical protein
MVRLTAHPTPPRHSRFQAKYLMQPALAWRLMWVPPNWETREASLFLGMVKICRTLYQFLES